MDDAIDDEPKPYYISKRTFYFFHSVYGGGPAVVENIYFDEKAKPLSLNGISSKFDDQSSNSSNTPRRLNTLNNQIKPSV